MSKRRAGGFWSYPVTVWLELLDDIEDKGRIARVARLEGVQPDTIRRYLQHISAIRRKFEAAGWQAPPSRLGGFENEWHAYCQLIGRDPSRPLPAPPPSPAEGRRVVCAIADTHGNPFIPGIRYMLDHSRPDVVVVAGDVFDLFAFSRWPKSHQEPVEDELARVRILLEVLSGGAGEVLLLAGNHDKRALKYFMQRVDERYLFLVQSGLLELVARGLPNVKVVEQWFDYQTMAGVMFPHQLQADFFVMLGDALFAHPEISRRWPLAAPSEFGVGFTAWASRLGLRIPVVVATGHQHVWAVGQGDVIPVVAQLGYMGAFSSLQYNLDVGRLPRIPPEPGYLHLEQTQSGAGEWVTDLNAVHYHLIPREAVSDAVGVVEGAEGINTP